MTLLPDINPHDWNTLQPHFQALLDEELTPEQVPQWLHRWSDLENLYWETRAGLKRTKAREDTDEARAAFQKFVDEIFPYYQLVNQKLRTKLLRLPNYNPLPDQQPMLRDWHNQADLFREENVILQNEIRTLVFEHEALINSIYESMDEQDETQANPLLDEPLVRERDWRAESQVWLRERKRLDTLFFQILKLRHQLAHNAGLPNYRAYRWRELNRFDFTPADCRMFAEAIEAEIVPLAVRWRDSVSRKRGLSTPLRPWDLSQTWAVQSPSRLFKDAEALADMIDAVFTRMDSELGELFSRMRQGFLDIDMREGDWGGGEEWLFPVTRLPQIRMRANGTVQDPGVLSHEMGHAFNDFLILTRHNLYWQLEYPDEFSELPSTTLPYLILPHLSGNPDSLFSAETVTQYLIRILQEPIRFLPVVAMTDTFQNWIYGEVSEDVRPEDLDAKWLELSTRFWPDIDGTGLEAERGPGWQRALFLFDRPFYIIGYGLAHFGALDIWRNSQADWDSAWQAYKSALTLGNSRPLAELYTAAGARLPFDREIVREVAGFIASHLEPVWG